MYRFRALSLAIMVTLGVGAAVWPQVAQAQDAVAAEKVRLLGEMRKLASKNAWTGVESKYEELEKLKLPLGFDDYYLGAQSAKFLGKTWETYQRLEKAGAVDARPEIASEIEAIDARYGRVEIRGSSRRRPPLEVDMMPFAQDERKSVEWAITVVANTGAFKGMVPLDVNYVVAGQTFVSIVGADWQIIDISKSKVGPKVETIRWAGPIASMGYQTLGSSEPPAPEDSALLQPGAVSAGGYSARLGGELGFTEVFGVAASLGSTGAWGGQDQFVGFTAGVGPVIRPGNARISISPTYGLLVGRGFGTASWWNVGQDREVNPDETVKFKGYALVGGIEATAGYGLFDLGSWQAMAELGGAWQSDGSRSYSSLLFRVGLMPKIDRFEQ